MRDRSVRKRLEWGSLYFTPWLPSCSFVACEVVELSASGLESRPEGPLNHFGRCVGTPVSRLRELPGHSVAEACLFTFMYRGNDVQKRC